MKTVLVYDRVNKWGGAERVLLALHEIFPDADLATAVYSSDKAKWARVFPNVKTTFLQSIPFAKDKHEFLGLLTPIAFESLDLAKYELVISVTSEAAKGIITRPGQTHICYCLTPTRYLWSGYEHYFSKGSLLRSVASPAVSYLRRWDRIAGERPDTLVAISTAVAARIRKYYGRDAEVIFPPVEIEKFSADGKVRKGDFFLMVGRLVSYKRFDLAVGAFNRMGLPLIIVGKGSEEARLKRLAHNNIKFVGELTDASLADYYRKCLGLIFPQEEDFGIVAVEAQAAGAPVIAFRAGGAVDTVIEGKTGTFFDIQSEKALMAAVTRFRTKNFDRQELIKNAEKFSKENFQRKFRELTE
ncbi:MAG TPA: glycosyltransferase [Patescibacteria group bacterium]|uniref:Glycosyl transferase family 1 domain-containing protein n=1 Tax=Candidatus Woesebacteria bacterium RBG_13_46_13 TaxID=1802479 RepID=A0A1F7X4Q0_9BACT|nr:MAG: hypothetical protein A2Y68_00040 [Candidatus Woesebacteria bacterium RBG_13_46_13]HJX58957.1 glycosyltransferase [Patescibacteria group bacterium]